MLLQATLASPPSAPDSLYPPIPHRSPRHHFVSRALLASNTLPLFPFPDWPTPLPRGKDSMARKSRGQLSSLPAPSTHIPFSCPRHQIPEHSAWEKHKRERSTIVGPSATRVRKPEKFSPCCNSAPHSAEFSCRGWTAPLSSTHFSERPNRAAEKTLDAHPSAGPGDCHCLPARRHRAGNALPPRPAKRHGLFSGRPHRALVGPCLLHRGHGNVHAHNHRRSGHFLRRKSYLPSTGLRLPDRPRAHRAASAPRIFSRRILHRLRAH